LSMQRCAKIWHTGPQQWRKEQMHPTSAPKYLGFGTKCSWCRVPPKRQKTQPYKHKSWPSWY